MDRTQEYEERFLAECRQSYPCVDAVERRFGYALDRDRYEPAARILACPLKVSRPNWQHGRVLYAAARARLNCLETSQASLFEIGSAKGYGALCLLWALMDSGLDGTVVSVDVIDPMSTESRNSIRDLEGPTALAGYLRDWPESSQIQFVKSTGVKWLQAHPERVHFAFVDGKHSGSVVKQEGQLLTARQSAGDIVVFDDVHLPEVWQAVHSLEDYYTERLDVLPARSYGLAVRL